MMSCMQTTKEWVKFKDETVELMHLESDPFQFIIIDKHNESIAITELKLIHDGVLIINFSF